MASLQPNIVFAPRMPTEEANHPIDCKTLIVAGPSRKLSDEAPAAIEAYMDGNGKLPRSSMSRSNLTTAR